MKLFELLYYTLRSVAARQLSISRSEIVLYLFRILFFSTQKRVKLEAYARLQCGYQALVLIYSILCAKVFALGIGSAADRHLVKGIFFSRIN